MGCEAGFFEKCGKEPVSKCECCGLQLCEDHLHEKEEKVMNMPERIGDILPRVLDKIVKAQEKPDLEVGKAFYTCPKGFKITFPNGITLSTQIGYGNYCENRNYNRCDFTDSQKEMQSDDCEIAIWDIEKNWVTREVYQHLFKRELHDDVVGWVKLSEWLHLVVFLATTAREELMKQWEKEKEYNGYE
jgi:hypothetical protein